MQGIAADDLVVGKRYVVTSVAGPMNDPMAPYRATFQQLQTLNWNGAVVHRPIFANSVDVTGADNGVMEFDDRFYTFAEDLSAAIGKKAGDQRVRVMYEKATGQSAEPGTGPADMIRQGLGVQPPRGAMGGRRRTRRRRARSTRDLGSRKTRRRHR